MYRIFFFRVKQKSIFLKMSRVFFKEAINYGVSFIYRTFPKKKKPQRPPTIQSRKAVHPEWISALNESDL